MTTNNADRQTASIDIPLSLYTKAAALGVTGGLLAIPAIMLGNQINPNDPVTVGIIAVICAVVFWGTRDRR